MWKGDHWVKANASVKDLAKRAWDKLCATQSWPDRVTRAQHSPIAMTFAELCIDGAEHEAELYQATVREFARLWNDPTTGWRALGYVQSGRGTWELPELIYQESAHGEPVRVEPTAVIPVKTPGHSTVAERRARKR
jgi:hypothetical protein